MGYLKRRHGDPKGDFRQSDAKADRPLSAPQSQPRMYLDVPLAPHLGIATSQLIERCETAFRPQLDQKDVERFCVSAKGRTPPTGLITDRAGR